MVIVVVVVVDVAIVHTNIDTIAHTIPFAFVRRSSDDPARELKLVAARDPGVDYSVVDFDGRFWIRSNRNGAVDFALVSAPHDSPSEENWRIEIPHRPGVLILEAMAQAAALSQLVDELRGWRERSMLQLDQSVSADFQPVGDGQRAEALGIEEVQRQ